jgi:AraC-like DNA-binding protein
MRVDVRRALEAMREQPARDWTVEGLARVAGLSRAAFARRFARASGRPPMGYLAGWRMTPAAEMLRETDEPLAAVAGRDGYSNPYAFAAAFKRLFVAELLQVLGVFALRGRRPAPEPQLHERMPLPSLQDVFRLMGECPKHVFQILTKRHERLVELWLGSHLAPGAGYASTGPSRTLRAGENPA